MSKKVLVISTSLRKNSNSETLADAFLAGAKASGNQVEKISLRGKKNSLLPRMLSLPKYTKMRYRG